MAHAWLLGLTGLALFIFGVLLMLFPGAGALAVVWLIGVYAIVFGVLLLELAYRLWRAQRERPGVGVADQAGRGRGWLHQLR